MSDNTLFGWDFPDKTQEWDLDELEHFLKHVKTHGLTNLSILLHQLNKSRKTRTESQLKTLFYTVGLTRTRTSWSSKSST